uniref:Uncharacterized protein n=1 Tax=Oryza meridionalis TaxID=40149 RepID=A0A0E0C1Q5_9ORYZ
MAGPASGSYPVGVAAVDSGCGGGGPADQDDGAGDEEEYLDRDAYTDALLNSFLPCCIHGFKHDAVELVEAFLPPTSRRRRRQLARDWTREVTPDRADDMARLFFAGLHAAAEPPEAEAEAAAATMSAAGFVDRLHMRMLVHAFFHPDMVDVCDEGKDTRSDRSFMAATGFVDRLWDVRRIIDVCRDGGLDDGERRATVAGMLRRFEELLEDRARAVKLGTFKITS